MLVPRSLGLVAIDMSSLYVIGFTVWNANGTGFYFYRVMQDRSPDDQHGWRTDLRLRLAGACLLACCVLAVRALIAFHAQHAQLSSGPMALGLCGISFITGSLGAGLLMLGHHVFDTVEVGPRWAPRPPSSLHRDASRAAPSPDDADQLVNAYTSSRVSGLRPGDAWSFFNLWATGQASK